MSNAALDHSEFLARRKDSLGGSDIAVVMGLSKYKTPMQLWQEKTGLVESGSADSEAAYWGTTLEDLVAKEYATRTGNKVQRVNAQLKHADHKWMAGNIDRAVVAPGTVARADKNGRLHGAAGILECKTASAYLTGMWDGDSAPVQYVAQCQWYMAITGATWTDLAVLIGGQHFKIIRIDADPEIQQVLIAAGSAFWNDCVLAGVPPAPQTSAEVIQLYPQS
uniref:YqaJ viral recombinase family nuclease n=1 Tax=Rheinheimera sp. TaxID=1869214 RepID=UPI004047466C